MDLLRAACRRLEERAGGNRGLARTRTKTLGLSSNFARWKPRWPGGSRTSPSAPASESGSTCARQRSVGRGRRRSPGVGWGEAARQQAVRRARAAQCHWAAVCSRRSLQTKVRTPAGTAARSAAPQRKQGTSTRRERERAASKAAENAGRRGQGGKKGGGRVRLRAGPAARARLRAGRGGESNASRPPSLPARRTGRRPPRSVQEEEDGMGWRELPAAAPAAALHAAGPASPRNAAQPSPALGRTLRTHLHARPDPRDAVRARPGHRGHRSGIAALGQQVDDRRLQVDAEEVNRDRGYGREGRG